MELQTLTRPGTTMARRTPGRAASLGRLGFGLLFAAGAAVHVAIVMTGTETYRHFTNTAFIPLVKQAWLTVFMPHAALLGLLLAGFELTVGRSSWPAKPDHPRPAGGHRLPPRPHAVRVGILVLERPHARHAGRPAALRLRQRHAATTHSDGNEGAMKVPVTAATKHGATGSPRRRRTLRSEHGEDARSSPPRRSPPSTATTPWTWAARSTPATGWRRPGSGRPGGGALAGKPVWLFSSGPVGDPPRPEEDPVDIADVLAATKAREHRVFAGRLDKRRLGFGERAIVVALRVREGDFRNWAEIQGWASQIADSLRTGA